MVFWDLGGFGWMITLMNDGWRLDPKDLYTNLKVLVLRPLCTFGHLTKTFSTIGRKVFLPKHGPGMCRSPAEVADRLGYLIPGATADTWLARAYDNGSLRLWLQAPNDCQVSRDLNPIFP